MHPFVLAGTSFLASAVEAVEAVTIVLAVGYTHGWRAALMGSAWALGTLAAIIIVLGPALLHFVPLSLLQLVIGLFLTLFGFTWLRKAVWRYGGRKALHDEQAIFDRELSELRAARSRRIGLITAFNAVLLEGFEIVVIVVGFAAATVSGLLWAAAGALLAAIVVTIAGVMLRRPLAAVPENTMKFVVGIMLSSLGTYWAGEGLGLHWPMGDAELFLIIFLYCLLCGSLVYGLRHRLQKA